MHHRLWPVRREKLTPHRAGATRNSKWRGRGLSRRWQSGSRWPVSWGVGGSFRSAIGEVGWSLDVFSARLRLGPVHNTLLRTWRCLARPLCPDADLSKARLTAYAAWKTWGDQKTDIRGELKSLRPALQDISRMLILLCAPAIRQSPQEPASDIGA